MANLINCANGYVCFEGLVEFLMSLFYLFYLIISYRILTRDKSGVLVDVDKYLCSAALAQTLLQTVYFLYFGNKLQPISRKDNDILLSTIRCMGIAMQIMICNILGSVIADEEQTPQVWQLARGLLVVTLLLWVWFGIFHRGALDYDCVQVDYLILSGFGLFLACGSFYMGNLALEGMQEYKNTLDVARSGAIQVQQHALQYKQVTMRMTQITLMHYCGLLQFGMQFAFDLFTYLKCDTSSGCTEYYNATSFLSVLLLTIFKLISFTTIPATIFWIFYEMNKNKFQDDDQNAIEMKITQ
ncbi:unnamed protein product (macronuclear) [Paramecium tetraurelia]|uniref:THH1/TOM1/TOM3 domain-containing protein n=1 Tax=Paramecium tetraurelia TaxID=5888 RepID=A0BYN9_PARTE|nr:uncharacterized protein GSPATT00033509001 [Paramecium tetraurelia]CAK63656.1 unnamed protein product [Paramecium tetraurelia]|eukprot:XP_001431054.1 hypothetical protein (macronuclear) [Paramecium tetraurelia strain d4-2]